MPFENLKLKIRREPEARDLPLPGYATSGSAGIDLLAAVDSETVIAPGERRLISTGIRIAIPDGFEGQVRPRSGLALKHGISMVNTPGTIDSDYRGVLQVIVINHGQAAFSINRGDRIAQLVLAPVARAILEESDDLSETARNEGGFGHTGK